jgi:hypothetical protein
MDELMQTDWKRIDALTDEQIDTSDAPPLTDKFFATAHWRLPKDKVAVTMDVEPEIKSPPRSS